MQNDYKISSGTRIGHVHLKVTDLNRALDFYCGLLGFELMTTYGKEATRVMLKLSKQQAQHE